MTDRVHVNALDNDQTKWPSWTAQGAATTYAEAGVDTAEGARAVDAIKDAVHRTYRDEVRGDIGGFGGLFSIKVAKQMADPILVSGTDGVGTKIQLAKLAGKHDTVGIDLVAMCVNDILATGAEPLFFLDYIAIGKLKSEAVAEIVSGIADGCEKSGCALIGGEMAEHPGVMDPHEYDLSGFCVGVVDRPEMLDPLRVQAGDVLVGLASSGIHSNGYSLVRKVVTDGKTLYELRIPQESLGGRSTLDALLEPTRIYVKPVREVLRRLPGAVRSLAHITGGGITENLNRAMPADINAEVHVGTWDMPPIIPFVCHAARLDETEALKTFNMGLGMVLVVAPDKVNAVMDLLREQGEAPVVVGQAVPGTGEVVYVDKGQLFSGTAAEVQTDEDGE